MKSKFEVGQRVIMCSSVTSRTLEVIVSRIGRRWVYVTAVGSSVEMAGRAFDRETGMEKDYGYAARGKLLTLEEADEKERRAKVIETLRKRGFSPASYHFTQSTELLERVAALLSEEEAK